MLICSVPFIQVRILPGPILPHAGVESNTPVFLLLIPSTRRQSKSQNPRDAAFSSEYRDGKEFDE
jgi:hypothetical protein